MTTTPSPPHPAAIRAVPPGELRFREVFDGNFRELLGYALRRTGSGEDAADIVSETMLVAWRRIDEVPTDETARLWLYGVARRVLANHRRGLLRRERLGERLRRQLVSVVPDLSDAVDSAGTIRQAMAELSEADRELIMLTSWEDLDPQEIAVVLGVPAGTVRTRLHRARGRLRKVLGDAFADDGHVREDQQARTAQEER
jgi:RNA polymerase sigma factor (sigma-70 family)